MTCTGDWTTHHDACDCREAARAEELAVMRERLAAFESCNRARAAAEAEVAALRAELATCERGAAARQREACAARLTALLERRGATAVWVDEHDMLLTPLVTDGAGDGGES